MARPEAAPFLGLPESAEVVPPGWSASVAFPGLTFESPVALAEGPHTGHLFVAEREGRLFAFPDDHSTTTRILVLDLSAVTQGLDDSGLLGLAFHPEFGEEGSENADYFYVHYAHTASPVLTGLPDPLTPSHSRLARFTIDRDSLIADPESELVLIDQQDESVWHQGGAMFFHPEDGFLYLSIGDEGYVRCELDNCQRMDKDLFSGVLRIDVDLRGGEVSHPIPRQPETGRTANYFIPNDNPFVGQPGVLEEFYALGLRSPHRMTHDPEEGLTWIADVGEVQQEEIDILAPGANYQWNSLEGTAPGTRSVPDIPLGVWTDPIFTVPRSEIAVLIGGYVYRGERLPELRGRYVFADFVSGGIWAMSYQREGDQVFPEPPELLVQSQFRDRTNGITSFGVDLSGHLYVLPLGPGAQVHWLERSGGSTNAPTRLSETQVFSSVVDLEPATSLVDYAVIAPLWSDGATKRRWASVPTSASVRFSDSGAWQFPPGSVLVKHFDLALDQRQPSELRRLETRVLVAKADGTYYGLSYLWNDAETDADLLMESRRELIDVTLSDGSVRRLRYFFPGPNDCSSCHTAEAGGVLGLTTAQLNAEHRYLRSGQVANQLVTWSNAGLLDADIDAPTAAELPRLFRLDDESASLTQRVRSYWDANCSACHGSVGGIKAAWDARFEVPVELQNVIYGSPVGGVAAGQVLISPGDLSSSLLYERSRSVVPGFAMPPIGRSVSDPQYVDLLERWVQELGERLP